MNRPTRRIAGLALAIVATLAALPVQASAAPSAGEEYVLEIPGSGQPDSVGSTTGTERSDRAAATTRTQNGTVGETDVPDAPLDALVSAAAAIPTSLLAGIVALIALALTVALPSRRAARAR